MNYVGKLLSNFKGFYKEINSATLTGAIDIVIVKQEDGSYATSPWHVRFGKLGVMRSREKVVDIEINGVPADIQMKLGEAGEAFFVEPITQEDGAEIPDYLATSPIPDSLDLMEEGLKMLHDLPETLPETIIPVAELIETSAVLDNADAPYERENIIGHRDVLENADLEAVSRENFNSLVGAASEDATTPTAETELEDVTPTGDGDGIVKTVESVTQTVAQQAHAKPDLTKELSIVVESEEGIVFDSRSHFRPVNDSIDTKIEIGIQTDMTGAEAETKASRTRLSSGNSCVSLGTNPSSSDLPSTTVPTTINQDQSAAANKVPSFIRLDSEKEILKAKDRKRRRRKKLAIQGRKQRQLDLGGSTTESGSSLEEGLFDLEMSGEDETDDAGPRTMVPRTISMPMIEHSLSRTDEWACSQYAASLHPFSDGDITPLVSPVSTRPPSPKSDTEYEIKSHISSRFDSSCQTQLTGDDMATFDSVRWRWGELPENDTTIKPLATTMKQEEKASAGGLFQFMRKTKKIRHQPEQEGIYLDDLNLNEMDPEVAALYLYQSKSNVSGIRAARDEDSESGRGASLPQSPVTVEGVAHNTGNIGESGRGASLPQSPVTVEGVAHNTGNIGVTDLALSLCGGLSQPEGVLSHETFLQSLVTYDEFCQDPNILNSPNLVLKMADKYYNWQIAGPIIMSVLAFQRPLPERAVEELVKQHMPKKEAARRRGWIWWGRSGAEQPKSEAASPPSSNPPTAPNSPEKAGKAHNRSKEDSLTEDTEPENAESLDRNSVSIDIPITTTESVSVATQMSPPIDVNSSSGMKFHKSLKLSSEKIAMLNLQEGVNEVSFSVTTQFQGTTRCEAYIYLWNWDDRIIISDIDGTITKSDVLGQVLPMIGKDWSQAGIANLYNEIRQNGYRFVYLSARAIGQSKITRDYLKNVRQGELGLPDGPLLLSPSSLISAFHKEVIERRPQDFKISCLRDIKALFPTTHNPFYAGFGNKINDVWAYQAVNIPITRIFTVNHRGELKHELTCTFQSSYTKMSDTVDHLFPPLLDTAQDTGKIHSGNFPAPDEFSNFTYWREPLPDIEVEDLDELLAAKK